jgi:hypothetical protein
VECSIYLDCDIEVSVVDVAGYAAVCATGCYVPSCGYCAGAVGQLRAHE